MFYETIKAAALIFLAEMGDKTQLLAMAFALRYSVKQVLLGVAAGSFLNHGLAVLIGYYLGSALPLGLIKLGSAALFLCFSVWGLFAQSTSDEEDRSFNGSPILAVALAFFLGELGDKTQLTAVALASSAQSAGAVLLGTVTGMVLTSLVGIAVGVRLGERIPEFALKLISSGVFIAFGFFHLIQAVLSGLINPAQAGLVLLAPLVLLLILLLPPLRQSRSEATDLKGVARRLKVLDQALNELCLAEERCRGKRCPVGYCKKIVKETLAGNNNGQKPIQLIEPYLRKGQCFDEQKVARVWSLLETLDPDSALYQELKSNLEKLRAH